MSKASEFPMPTGAGYIVRIYRRAPGSTKGLRRHDGVTLTGIVERSDTGERRSFHGFEQLWAILCEEQD